MPSKYVGISVSQLLTSSREPLSIELDTVEPAEVFCRIVVGDVLIMKTGKRGLYWRSDDSRVNNEALTLVLASDLSFDISKLIRSENGSRVI